MSAQQISNIKQLIATTQARIKAREAKNKPTKNLERDLASYRTDLRFYEADTPEKVKALKGIEGVAYTEAGGRGEVIATTKKPKIVTTAETKRVGVKAEKTQDLMADIDQLKRDADKLQSQIGVTKKQQDELKKTIKEIEATRDKLRGKRQELKDIRETAAKIEKIRDELTETKPMYRVGGTDRQAVVLKAAVKTREKVIKPVLTSLQGIITHFESKAGFASVEEINNYIKTTPGGRLGPQFRPKTVDELINRLAFASAGMIKGGVKEVTLPLSWGLSPPTTEAQRAAEFLGAVVTPSPLDYVVVKTFSKLYSMGKKGKAIISKVVRGSSLTDEEISILEKTWEIDKKLSQGKQYSLEDLLDIGKKKNQNKLDALYEKAGQFFKNVDAEDAGKAAKRLDETLSVAGVDGQDWAEGIDIKAFYDPDKQRAGLKIFKEQIKKQSDILGDLFDLDPEKLVEWNTLTAKQKIELMELVKKWQKVWADNPGIYHMTAGGSRQTLLQKQIDELLDAADMSELDFLKAHGDDFTTLSPAALTVLLERLNKTTSGEIVASDVDEGLLRDAKEGYLVLQDLTDIVDETIDEETGIIEDVDIVEDEEEEERVKPTPDQKLEDTQIQEEEEEETTIPIPEEILTEEEEPTPTFLPESKPEERRDIRLRLWGGPREKYKVKFSFPQGQSQTVTVEARSFPEAVNRAQRRRRGNRYLPSMVDVEKVN